eukprot:TRINITY_DN7038_c0_g1_i1.p1 TRINITY_DN7038_c0_g1~~TRINITY_DN7038_c0_g1_i1.p1  ORF type:complete len:122 (+),score=17.01 TRINITY_DN7038_c0_g1_i1:125-490(+)
MPTHHAINYIEITVTDITKAKEFYTNAFGWKFNDYGPTYAGICGQGQEEQGGLTEDTSMTKVGGGPLVVLYSDDIEASHAKALQAGATISKDIFQFPGGRRFHFIDPSGNELAVWSKPKPE